MTNEAASSPHLPLEPRAKVTAIAYLMRHSRLLVMALLFVAALSIRLYHVNDPPLNFHAVRQYHSLLIARGYYLETLTRIPEWKKQVARISRERRGMWEPHLMEFVVGAAYRVVGGEHFWIPRLLSSLAWLTGGGFLYLIAKRIANADAALFSTAFYLFLPFAIVASRSFQPDPLMVAALIVSIFAILRYFDKPSVRRLVVAASLGALAILVKFVALFAIVGAFAFAGIHTQGFRKVATSRRSLLFAVICLLPPFVFYSYQIFVSGSLLGVVRNDLLPQLVVEPSFWKGWLGQIDAVVGYPAWIGALLGTLVFRERLARGLMVGMWTGYLVFGLVFTYTVHTHDYWNLQIIPIVALSLGPVVALVIHNLVAAGEGWPRRVAIGAIASLALALSIGIAQTRLPAWGFERKVRIAQEIGEWVGHSTDVIYLSGDYGLPLEYHGLLSGFAWPLTSDLEWEQLAGVPARSPAERFQTWFGTHVPRYFIVEDLREFAQQPDLGRFLSRFPVVAQNDDYVIFALRGRLKTAEAMPKAP
jgi:hypothetical protein